MRRWGALPLGELHPEDACALCGNRTRHKHRVVIASTHAIGYRCVDSVACVRERKRRKG